MILLALATTFAFPATMSFADTTFQSDACSGLHQLDGTQGCGTSSGDNAVSNLASTVVTILSILIGAVSIIVILYAGFKYVTSGGDSNRVSSAKTTLIYAFVGLIIAALAQVIVHWVLNTAVGSV
jgi:hypothetical protein